CDDGLWPDRSLPGRTLPDQDPLYLHVAALSHRQWLVRRHAASARHRDRGGLWQHLCGPVVSDRGGADDRRGRLHFLEGNQGNRYRQDLTGFEPGGCRTTRFSLKIAPGREVRRNAILKLDKAETLAYKPPASLKASYRGPAPR